jgi:hypothetical protein
MAMKFKKVNNKMAYEEPASKKIYLYKDSTASQVEKWEFLIGLKAAQKSSELREYWYHGTDPNNYTDQESAIVVHEANFPNMSISSFLIQMNLNRAETVMSYSQLSEVEKIMFKSQLDSKERLKQQSWMSYQKERKIFLDSNAWLIAVISEHIDKSYLQYLIDFKDGKLLLPKTSAWMLKSI